MAEPASTHGLPPPQTCEDHDETLSAAALGVLNPREPKIRAIHEMEPFMGKHAHHRARRAPTCLEPAFTSKEALPGLGTLVLSAFNFLSCL